MSTSEMQTCSFINSSGAATYSATSGSNQKTMTFNNNFYGTDENTKVTPTTSNYDSLSLKSIDTVTYNTVADLKAAIEALN